MPLVTWALSAWLAVLLTDIYGGPGVDEPPKCESGFIFTICSFYVAVVPSMVALTLPQFLSLAPFLWAVSRKVEVRRASIIAGAAGLLHLGIPWLMFALSASSSKERHIFPPEWMGPLAFIPGFLVYPGRVAGLDGTLYFQFNAVGTPPDLVLFARLLLLACRVWLGTILIWWVFGRLRSPWNTRWRKAFESLVGVPVVLLGEYFLSIYILFIGF